MTSWKKNVNIYDAMKTKDSFMFHPCKHMVTINTRIHWYQKSRSVLCVPIQKYLAVLCAICLRFLSNKRFIQKVMGISSFTLIFLLLVC